LEELLTRMRPVGESPRNVLECGVMPLSFVTAVHSQLPRLHWLRHHFAAVHWIKISECQWYSRNTNEVWAPKTKTEWLSVNYAVLDALSSILTFADDPQCCLRWSLGPLIVTACLFKRNDSMAPCLCAAGTSLSPTLVGILKFPAEKILLSSCIQVCLEEWL